ncbi:DUF2637 domain-containing protein [Asanoa sp. NPDC049518]|uniref:DUF2637 domain-containing protein n=1 Tax=unclassified Asanoa TaxID=2685164 RepID=UPI003421ABF7
MTARWDRPVPVRPLVRLRWAVRAAFTLGMAASVAANILHAQPHPVSQVIAAWPSVALICTVEIMSRVPSTGRGLAAVRLTVTTVIAIIAAYVSYGHMVGVATRYGETGVAAYLLPLSVDGLVVVASISLVDITTHLARNDPPGARTNAIIADEERRPPHPEARPGDPPPLSHATPHSRSRSTPPSTQPPVSRSSGPTEGGVPERFTVSVDSPAAADRAGSEGLTEVHVPVLDAMASAPPADTREAVEFWRRRDATLHPAEIATRIGRSERTVRRHLRAAAR